MEKFAKLLSEATEETMRMVFGESASELIYRLMERQAALKREEIGHRIDDFLFYMKRLVGSEVAQIILTNSLRELLAGLQLEYEKVESYFEFLDELYEVKLSLLASPHEEEHPACN